MVNWYSCLLHYLCQNMIIASMSKYGHANIKYYNIVQPLSSHYGYSNKLQAKAWISSIYIRGAVQN